MTTHKGIFKTSEIETISSKLKFISKLKSGQKISVNNQSIQENTYWTSMSRSISGESRNKAYQFMSDVIKDSLSVLDSLSNSSNEYDIQICRNLITDLICLKPGLDNIQETYQNDKMYISKVQTLVENLDVKIHEICDKRDEINFEELFEDAQNKLHYEKEQSTQEQQEQEREQEQSPVVSEAEEAEDEEEQEEVNKSDRLTEEEVHQEISDSIEKKEQPDNIPELIKNLPTEDLLLMSTEQKSVPSKPPRQQLRRRRKPQSYQYNTYYMSTPDDVTLYNRDLEKGIIR